MWHCEEEPHNNCQKGQHDVFFTTKPKKSAPRRAQFIRDNCIQNFHMEN